MTPALRAGSEKASRQWLFLAQMWTASETAAPCPDGA